MRKNKIIFIAFLMGLALLGLIILQVNWIRHDLAIKQERFNQQVNKAMTDAVSKLETSEAVTILTRNIPGAFNDSAIHFFKNAGAISLVPPVPPMPPTPPEPVIAELTGDSFEYTFEETYDKITDSIVDEQVQIVKSKNGKRSKVIVSVNSYPGIKSVSSNIEDALENNTKKIAESQKKRAAVKMKRMTSVIEKMAYEFDMRNANLLDRIEPEIVDSLIGQELKKNGIRLPYSITLNQGNTDSVVWKRLLSKDDALKEYKANLFPGDIVDNSDYIKLGFSDTFGYLISTMWLMMISSAIFTLIIIFAFSYTVYVIFRQKKLSEMKNDFINNMTHEFKTPIATIRLASDAIGNPEVLSNPEKVSYYSKIIRDENERMNTHVENILQLAQFDKKDFTPSLEKVNIHGLIQSAIEKFKLQVIEKNGHIQFEPGSANPVIYADATYLPFVFMNLLDNSVKYCNENPLIKIHTSDATMGINITVSDNGIGMDQQTQHKIFDKFYRVTSGNIHNVKGFGLGLNYVKAILIAHNGTINVISEPGRGSTFTIFIPREKNYQNS